MNATGWLFSDPSQLHLLERMTIAAKGRVRGTMQGKRRSRLLGSSLEFADYRPYAPGDDIRRLDWNVYGRTGKAFIRQFWDEQEMNVRLCIDCSQSMRFGYAPPDGGEGIIPSTNKLAYALRLAACVAYAALAGEDRVSVLAFADRIVSEFPPARGKGAVLRLFNYMEKFIEPTVLQGTDDIGLPFSAPGAYPRTPGQTWLFTDGLYAQGLERVLNGFAASGQHVVLIQILGPEELAPDLSGERKLIDTETGAAIEVAFGRDVMRAYQSALRDHTGMIRKLCAERGFDYALADTSVPVMDTAGRCLLGEGMRNN
ncbi:DUF58 domain-containing protein [Cohnella sp. CFH 77786]|uniref:DUF58 domain-containing protein n=1 Tax=Cohnella sp. CFH 77786 TaxID=2662265 RepID=UPI001C611021|nr:DUF58 domain-containing protein [Cohnella sp. CFH 77786]MBW5448060.1 DUF58 domain-containing protein [Cohnella sp. CFH 77786]